MLTNPKQTKNEIVNWINHYFKESGEGCSAVVGISGGKDSSIVAALCIEALGSDRVVGVLMPNGKQADIDCSERLVEHLGIKSITVNIQEPVEALLKAISANMKLFTDNGHSRLSPDAITNLPARIRMATLYAVSQILPNGGRVANTCNRSEDYIGYSTKFGDSAGDFSPLGNLLVHEVRQVGYELDIPRDLVDKVPADGLTGRSDEDNFGFTYETLDTYIWSGVCCNEDIRDRIDTLHARNLHKLLPMPVFKP